MEVHKANDDHCPLVICLQTLSNNANLAGNKVTTLLGHLRKTDWSTKKTVDIPLPQDHQQWASDVVIARIKGKEPPPLPKKMESYKSIYGVDPAKPEKQQSQVPTQANSKLSQSSNLK